LTPSEVAIVIDCRAGVDDAKAADAGADGDDALRQDLRVGGDYG